MHSQTISVAIASAAATSNRVPGYVYFDGVIKVEKILFYFIFYCGIHGSTFDK